MKIPTETAYCSICFGYMNEPDGVEEQSRRLECRFLHARCGPSSTVASRQVQPPTAEAEETS